MTTRWARFARGWAAALFATLVAACSHTIAGGGAPSPVALMLALAFSGMVCVALAGKSLSRIRLSIAVGASQLMFHGVFSLIAPAPGGEAMSPAAGHTMMMTYVPLQATSERMHDHADPWMWLAHGIAAVVTVIALRHGERAFWALSELARLAFGTILTGLTRPPQLQSVRPARENAVAIERARLPRRLEVILSALGHRGPPAFAAQF